MILEIQLYEFVMQHERNEERIIYLPGQETMEETIILLKHTIQERIQENQTPIVLYQINSNILPKTVMNNSELKAFAAPFNKTILNLSKYLNNNLIIPTIIPSIPNPENKKYNIFYATAYNFYNFLIIALSKKNHTKRLYLNNFFQCPHSTYKNTIQHKTLKKMYQPDQQSFSPLAKVKTINILKKHLLKHKIKHC